MIPYFNLSRKIIEASKSLIGMMRLDFFKVNCRINISLFDCGKNISTYFSSFGNFPCVEPQEKIADNKESCENHQPKSISSYRIILDSTKITIAVFLVTILGGGIAAMGVCFIDRGHWVWGYIMVAFGLYVAFCAGLGIEFPGLHLPLSNWWRFSCEQEAIPIRRNNSKKTRMVIFCII